MVLGIRDVINSVIMSEIAEANQKSVITVNNKAMSKEIIKLIEDSTDSK